MDVNMFDFHLPEELIAQKPSDRRTDSRLLLLDKLTGKIKHEQFSTLIDHLERGDCLVLNDTKVIPARIYGRKSDTGAKVEVLLLNEIEPDYWEALVRPGRRLKTGAVIDFFAQTDLASSEPLSKPILRAKVEREATDGRRELRFTYEGSFYEILDRIGQMPLPPYIKEQLRDRDRYQTVYAEQPGSAAAPTAGLHFTTDYLQQIKNKGIRIAYITLHVGLGTFRPVSVDKVEDHHMHAEYYEISSQTATLIQETKREGKRVIAVGTTSARTLETVASEQGNGSIRACSGWTDIFIYPGYTFKVVDALLTNFHLPKSTLLMMISAFAGKEAVLNAYEKAIEDGYRFFSFGDAMFIYH